MSLFNATKKEKKDYELKIKNIIYPIDDPEKQEQIIMILRQFELAIPENKVKRLIDRAIYNKKYDYYDKIDFLIKDIFEKRLSLIETINIIGLINVLKDTANGIKHKEDALDTIFRGS